MSTRGRRFAAYLEMQKFKLTARLRSLLPVDLRLQCGREFDQRDIRNRCLCRDVHKDTLLPVEFLYCGRSEWDY
jgi:hypothetical protein